MEVVVVGGPSAVFRKFKPRLQEKGLQAKWHWEWKKTRYKKNSTRLPKGAAGVVILKTMIGHGLRNKAIELAKAKDLPYVEVEPNCKAMASIDLIFNRWGELNGPSISPDPEEKVTMHVEQSLKEAAQAVLQKSVVVQDRTGVLKETGVLKGEAWVELVLEETPELILDLDALQSKLSEMDVSLPDSEVQGLVEKVRLKWAHWGTRVDNRTEDFRRTKDRIMTIKGAWLQRFLASYGTDKLPSHAFIKERSFEIFGSKFQNYMLREAKRVALEASSPQLDLPLPDSQTDLDLTVEGLSEVLASKVQNYRADLENFNRSLLGELEDLKQKVERLTSQVEQLKSNESVQSLNPESKHKAIRALETLSTLGLNVQVKIGVTGDLTFPSS